MGKQKITKRQHYVPQFYLKNWCNNENKLWCYDTKIGEIYKTTPNDCCYIKYCYEIGKIGDDYVLPNTREQDYQRIENEIAPIISKYLKIMDDEPTFIRDVYNAEANIIKSIDKILNIQVDDKFNQKFLEYIMKSPNFERLDNTNPNSKNQLGGYFYHQLRDLIKDFYFSIAKTDDLFCISNNPVMYTPQVVFFPLNPRYALFFRRKQESNEKRRYRSNKLIFLDCEDAIACSTEYINRGDRFLYAKDKETLERVLSKYENLKYKSAADKN